jgi:hypothetical protein
MEGYIQMGYEKIGSDEWKWTEVDEFRVQCRAGEND